MATQMPLIETIVTLAGSGLVTGSGLGSSFKDLVDFLRDRAQLEAVLADLVEEEVARHGPRLRHLCLAGNPTFNKKAFAETLRSSELAVRDPEDLVPALLPSLRESLDIGSSIRSDAELTSVSAAILNAALRGMWKKVGTYPTLTNQLLLSTTAELATATKLATDTSAKLDQRVDLLSTQIEELAAFAKQAWTQVYDKLSDTAPPPFHDIDNRQYVNPFLLARAEDFNHNYENIAKLFQGSPEWDSIQRPQDNVVIEGGRGTGKSMLLRRLTAQAALTAARLSRDPHVSYADAGIPYFGVYVKLTRGYYDQLGASDTVAAPIAGLLAQHELNIEVFDAFVDTARWIIRNHGIPSDDGTELVGALSSLFIKATPARTLSDLQNIVQYEQDQIADYFRERAFGRDGDYRGSAIDTVTFLRKLSQIFRERLFPKQDVRLFILIDEFETLLDIQQIAINTVIKMRLPDLTCKIAARPAGRKTSSTFTHDDPIQDPRDFTEVTLEYDTTQQGYRELLQGIAEKRLRHAGYTETNVAKYLVEPSEAEVPEVDVEAKLNEMWVSGNRRNDDINKEFREKYRVAAIYRALRSSRRRKSHSGFEQYVLLSSGIVSSFMELAKYAFYFALSDQLPLHDAPAIPTYLQTEAAYRVSLRLLGTVGSNVPVVGITLEQLLTDLGAVLRSRLLHHPSEPEANRISVSDYERLSQAENGELAKVLDGAVIWSVFHLEYGVAAFRPRNRTRPPAAELLINRIYCPALGISPRARWRVSLSTTELRGLVDRDQRTVTFRQLMKSVGADRDASTRDLFKRE